MYLRSQGVIKIKILYLVQCQSAQEWRPVSELCVCLHNWTADRLNETWHAVVSSKFIRLSFFCGKNYINLYVFSIQWLFIMTLLLSWKITPNKHYKCNLSNLCTIFLNVLDLYYIFLWETDWSYSSFIIFLSSELLTWEWWDHWVSELIWFVN